jgi:hypothetical protein
MKLLLPNGDGPPREILVVAGWPIEATKPNGHWLIGYTVHGTDRAVAHQLLPGQPLDVTGPVMLQHPDGSTLIDPTGRLVADEKGVLTCCVTGQKDQKIRARAV